MDIQSNVQFLKNNFGEAGKRMAIVQNVTLSGSLTNNAVVQLGEYDQTAPLDWSDWAQHPAVINFAICLKCGAMVNRIHRWITLHTEYHNSQTYIMDEQW